MVKKTIKKTKKQYTQKQKQRQSINIKIDQSKKIVRSNKPAPVRQQVPQSLNLSLPSYSYLPQQQQPANAQNLDSLISSMSKVFERKKEEQKQEQPALKPISEPPQKVNITPDHIKQEYDEQMKVFGQFKLTPDYKPAFESSQSDTTVQNFNPKIIDEGKEEAAKPYIPPIKEEPYQAKLDKLDSLAMPKNEPEEKQQVSSSSSSSSIVEPGVVTSDNIPKNQIITVPTKDLNFIDYYHKMGDKYRRIGFKLRNNEDGFTPFLISNDKKESYLTAYVKNIDTQNFIKEKIRSYIEQSKKGKSKLTSKNIDV
jgi:hypothetical protein